MAPIRALGYQPVQLPEQRFSQRLMQYKDGVLRFEWTPSMVLEMQATDWLQTPVLSHVCT
jgi:hypothetical protein